MKLRVYVFDDDDVVLDVVGQIIRRAGHEAVCLDHPQRCEILNSPKCECPENTQCADAILSDRIFGDQDYVSFLTKQKKRGCKARLAFMSAAFSKDEHEWAAKNDITIFIKPFPMTVLLDWLNKIQQETNTDRKLLEFRSELDRPSPGRYKQ